MNKVDLIIIGGGPAGLTSGIYASRSGYKTIIIEKSAPGGKLNNTNKIENYPGMEGKSGWKLAMLFSEQAKNFGAEIIGGEVIEITNLDSLENKKVILSNGTEYISKTIIIASGLKPKKLNAIGYEKYFGKGISTCVVCDGGLYKGRDIAIIGGGNSATEESLYASKIVKNIYIINKFSQFKAEKITLDKLSKLDNVFPIHNTSVLEILGTDKNITGIKIFNEKNNEEKIINLSAVFTYIGWEAENYFIKDENMLDENGYIIVNENNMETKYKGVYAAGDTTPNLFRQITIASSDGTKAALSAVKYMSKL